MSFISELDAYSSVISTFRAQGSLDSNKQNVLDQLKRCFHISEDRHKAEARRVANSEKLTTISEL
jgi:ENT domain